MLVLPPVPRGRSLVSRPPTGVGLSRCPCCFKRHTRCLKVCRALPGFHPNHPERHLSIAANLRLASTSRVDTCVHDLLDALRGSALATAGHRRWSPSVDTLPLRSRSASLPSASPAPGPSSTPACRLVSSVRAEGIRPRRWRALPRSAVRRSIRSQPRRPARQSQQPADEKRQPLGGSGSTRRCGDAWRRC